MTNQSNTSRGRTAQEDLRENWDAFCDCDYLDDGDTFTDRMEAAGFIELLPVTDDDLEEPFAYELGIVPGGMVWHLTDAGRAALQEQTP